jgi:hypothetical protein
VTMAIPCQIDVFVSVLMRCRCLCVHCRPVVILGTGRDAVGVICQVFSAWVGGLASVDLRL